MKKLLTILIIVLLISCVKRDKRINYRKKDKIDSVYNIIQLHKGVLLVRLSKRNNSIEAMKRAGKIKLAEKIIKKNTLRNHEIVDAFRANFNFCPVYFFYSEHSKYVANNQLDSVVFLNDSLEFDSQIKMLNSIYYTAQFGVTEPDTRNYAESKYFDKGETKTTSYGGSGLTLPALIIKDQKFQQLRKPFPYYTREFEDLPFQKSVQKVVIKMDNKLNKYYKRKS